MLKDQRWIRMYQIRVPRYNKETEAAMQEARDILAGKTKAKSYASACELIAELNEE